MKPLSWLRGPEGIRLLRFCVVGGCGVVVNMVVFSIVRLSIGELPPLVVENVAVITGFIVSCFTNFLLNDRWTWADRRASIDRPFLSRMSTYYLVALAAGAVQIGTFNALLPALPEHAFRPHGANLIGIALGTLVNFVVNNRWTFRTNADREDP